MTNHLRLLGPWALAAGLSWSWATAADGPGPRAGAAPRGVQSGGLDDLRDDPLSGHDGRDAPRDGIDARPAMLLEGVGTADFPVTTGQPLAQRYIDQGVALLHGLWFDEAGRSFRRAAQLDGRCAIAYWGTALASPHDQDLRVTTVHADRASDRSNRRIALAAGLTRIMDRTRGWSRHRGLYGRRTGRALTRVQSSPTRGRVGCGRSRFQSHQTESKPNSCRPVPRARSISAWSV